MNKRKALFGAVVLALVALNLWRWLPVHEGIANSHAGTSAMPFDASAFELRVTSLPLNDSSVRRNLFAATEAAQPAAHAVVRKQALAPVPPPKTAEELEAERVAAEFAQLRLIAVVFQGQIGQAYVSRGNESYLVRVGDRIGEDLRVDAIDVDAVQIVSVASGSSVRLKLEGT